MVDAAARRDQPRVVAIVLSCLKRAGGALTRPTEMPRFPPGEYGQKYRQKSRTWALALGAAAGTLAAIAASLFIWYWFVVV